MDSIMVNIGAAIEEFIFTFVVLLLIIWFISHILGDLLSIVFIGVAAFFALKLFGF